MVTFLDFIHFRSTRGLARRCRKFSRHLINLRDKLEHDKALAREHTQEGEAKLVFNDWHRIFEGFKEEEENLELIYRNEEKVIYTENKDERELEEHFNKLMGELQGEAKEKLAYLMNIFKQIDSVMSDKLREFRQHQKDLWEGRTDRIRLALATDSSYEEKMRKQARLEGREIGFVHSEEKGLSREMKRLEQCVNKKLSAQEFEKVISEIHMDADRLKNDFMKEIEYMFDILEEAYTIHVRMLKELQVEIPADITVLEKEGLDLKYLNQIKEEYRALAVMIKNSLDKLFRMSRYEERHFSNNAQAA